MPFRSESGASGRASARPTHPCPCCRYVTLSRPGAGELCPVCFWEDVDDTDPAAPAEVNGLSLAAARRNFTRFGAKDHESRAFVLPVRDRSRYRPG